ncbi:cytochrome c oxidase subunit II [Pseudoclavibacter endophyticus]|uniref:aa3-type cytochrome oxidase subunit II n=1 Tax=Pseudoclavibacter endophyticus TaxID=1778590 RepID=UPI00199EDF9B|nr:cytochrome c oxidase subunit II [Pseudoclavibacter endophyticus]GGA55975.1 cytochrome c oxidase subunit II [Pseudoclavibacter endophyticus]
MRKDHRSKWIALPLAGLIVAVLAACTPQQYQQGWLPGEPGVSSIGDMVMPFWVNSWITLVALGVFVWGLIIWCLVAYRRRKTDTAAPRQLRYHMPIEILFTVMPLILVGGFFAFTARDSAAIENNYAVGEDAALDPDNAADVHIEVYGKQWAWDFNYLPVDGSEYDGDVYYEGVQAQPTFDEDGNTTGEIDEASLPVLYVPVGAQVLVDLKSRDVAHSFWIIDFHYKEDTIPGKTNQMSFTADRVGTYLGKCAELCGEYHAMMLFQVHVVEADEYNAYIQSLRDEGNVGSRGDEYNRNNNLPGTEVPHHGPEETE